MSESNGDTATPILHILKRDRNQISAAFTLIIVVSELKVQYIKEGQHPTSQCQRFQYRASFARALNLFRATP